MTTFLKWLTGRQEREDRIGHISRIVINTKKKKTLSSNYYEWFFYREKLKSSILIVELNEAREEYKHKE